MMRGVNRPELGACEGRGGNQRRGFAAQMHKLNTQHKGSIG
jgi:hypothetical protein